MKVGSLVKTKQGATGYIVRRFVLDGNIYCQIQMKGKRYEYKVFKEKELEVVK